MGERTGSRVFQWVWSYVAVSMLDLHQVAKLVSPFPKFRRAWKRTFAGLHLKAPCSGNLKGLEQDPIQLARWVKTRMPLRREVEAFDRSDSHEVQA
ncbi:hypothetical protein CCHR01_18445 [Colletotrichum chrysophilum]|uniref:Uncharacterized protein n=1 Tax=Colletotrichum chrysophilum TaxID=1836956 RepID=A0AAD9E604_9PEZI|nr:hypothetical protein CCHR01_18445 [Colletotrichum chrysophilum]